MQFSESFVRRPVMATAINLVLLILGLVAYHQLELRHTPNVPQSEVNISTVFPGANSQTTEHQITKPLEDALAGIDGVRKITSTSQDSRSDIYVKFKSGQASIKGLNQVRDRVLAATAGLPEGVKRSEITEQSENNPDIMYIMFDDKTRGIGALSDYIHRVVEDRLRLVDGVSGLTRYGNQMYFVAIKPDPALLMEHQVTIKEVVDALHREKSFASGGEIEGVTNKEPVILTAVIEKPEDFSDVTVKITQKGRIRVGDVAEVSVGLKHTCLRLREDGRYRVGLGVRTKPQSNPLVVAKEVQAFVKDLQKTLPPSMTVSVDYDATQAFAASFTEMRHTLWEAIILVGIIVTLSLASIRAALFPMITVPLCLVGSFALMWALGFSINPVTLLALVLAVGLVVDDAIVVVENIHRHMENGMTSLNAAIASMKEITFAVVVMTITLAAVYVPLVFQANDAAAAFREFAWTLAGSVIISGFVALTLTPALCGKFLKDSKKIMAWEKLAHLYRKGLKFALQHQKAVVVGLVVAVVLGVWGFQRLPAEFKPMEDDSYIQGSIHADNGVASNVRDSWFVAVEDVLKTVKEQEHILTGVWQEQWMWWNIILKPSEDRNRTAKEIVQELNQKLKGIVGPQVSVTDNAGFSGDAGLQVIIQYAGLSEKLTETFHKIKNEVKEIPGFGAVTSDQAWEKPRLKVLVDRRLASELGVSIQAIEETLHTFLSGKKTGDYNFQGQDYDVQVRAPFRSRSEFSNLNEYFVTGGEGQWVPLGSLVSVKEVLEPNQIKHFDRMRGTSINVALLPGMALDKAIQILDPIIKKHIPKDARFHFGGLAEQYQETSQSTWLTFGLALAFIYLVLAALFESFIYPFIVLLTVPLSVVGAVWAINLIGGTNNIYTVIGLVTLIGLITKHGILIVDFTNRLRAEGHSLHDAIMHAAESRLRPVLMTTFAMICGAVPLVTSIGSGAIAREHIGWIIIGGMLTGTLLSLFVIPVVYNIVAKRVKP